jgi:hypothetical protein
MAVPFRELLASGQAIQVSAFVIRIILSARASRMTIHRSASEKQQVNFSAIMGRNALARMTTIGGMAAFLNGATKRAVRRIYAQSPHHGD